MANPSPFSTTTDVANLAEDSNDWKAIRSTIVINCNPEGLFQPDLSSYLGPHALLKGE
jgi:hypothetical protein